MVAGAEGVGLLVIEVAAEGDDIHVSLLGHPVGVFQHLGFEEIVAVQQRQVFAGGVLQTRVPGSAGTAVFLVDRLDSGVPGSVFLQNCQGIVLGIVIHADDLNIRQGLGQNAVQAAAQHIMAVIDRDNDTYFRHSGKILSLFVISGGAAF